MITVQYRINKPNAQIKRMKCNKLQDAIKKICKEENITFNITKKPDFKEGEMLFFIYHETANIMYEYFKAKEYKPSTDKE